MNRRGFFWLMGALAAAFGLGSGSEAAPFALGVESFPPDEAGFVPVFDDARKIGRLWQSSCRGNDEFHVEEYPNKHLRANRFVTHSYLLQVQIEFSESPDDIYHWAQFALERCLKMIPEGYWKKKIKIEACPERRWVNVDIECTKFETPSGNR